MEILVGILCSLLCIIALARFLFTFILDQVILFKQISYSVWIWILLQTIEIHTFTLDYLWMWWREASLNTHSGTQLERPGNIRKQPAAVIIPCFSLHTWLGLRSSRDKTLLRLCPRFPVLTKVTFPTKHFPSSNKHKSFGRRENDTDNAHGGPGTHAHVSKQDTQRRRPLCLSSSRAGMTRCLRGLNYSCSERLTTDGEGGAEAEHANNLLKSFCSSSLSEDRLRTVLLGPDE